MQGRLLAAGGIVLALWADGAEGAKRAFAGANGKIVFERERPAFSDEMAGVFHTDLWSVVPGRRARPLLRRREGRPCLVA